jgi:hypothetical protein
MVDVAGGHHMAKKSKLKDMAVKIGTAAGTIDGKAHKAIHKAAEAAHVANEELIAISKQVESLKKQLAKSSKRLQSALK